MKKQMKKQGKQDTNSTDFCTVWKVNAGDMIEFNVKGDFTIDWGDGCTEQVKDKDNLNKHTYVKKGEYTVSISPGVTRFWLNHNRAKKLIEIKQWGTARWEGMHSMFDGASNMVCTATDTPDLSKVIHMAYMFYECSKFNSPIEHWDTKDVKNMGNMLSHALMFNRSLAKMDISSLKYTSCMLEDTPKFNQDLRGLNIGVKVDTNDMFGWDKSLAQYNEKYGVQEQKQELMGVLTP